jgi:hypothetical protein
MKLRLLFILLLGIQFAFSQNFNSTLNNYLNQESTSLGFARNDLDEIQITDKSFSKSMNLNMVYVQQHFQGVPVYNAIGSFAIKNNEVLSFKHSFVKNINDKIQNTSFNLTAEAAINSALNHLELELAADLELLETRKANYFIFKSENTSAEVIPVELMYVPDSQNQLKLAWNLSILTSDESHWWSMAVDANTSEIIKQNDWMLSCKFETDQSHEHSKSINNHTEETLSITNDGSTYRAYPLGVESPNHGNRVVLSEPADPIASPFGWHDTDGVAGPEFTITRGNNVIASEDRDADNLPGHSPDGGSSLSFDFPIDPNLPPSFNEDAAITNLFVWNNYTHDVWYHYGFDEASGNFQDFNYSGLGADGDFVFADAQDGGGLNNANFGTPPDGFNPRMQMFLWSPPGPPSDPLTINSPSDISGDYFGFEAAFGPGLTPTPITADLALLEDDNSASTSSDPHNACDPIINSNELNGKIAVIRRGECTFVEKIEAAENAGAIAVIMINNVIGDPIVMGGAANNIGIPSIMISLSNGNPILTKLQNDEIINATLVNNGPYEIDGNYDNGIIAHEYGHGISNRLTGGPSQANCLFNDEQMGEGWSDWIGLMMTIRPGDTGNLSRGYGTFAINQSTSGVGIRPAPYSTDTSLNPATFGITNNQNISQPHGVGFVWATVLWDLTWELIDQYGFDPDLINGNGGNNLAMQLVTDGMKLQSCNPGFIDGRDAILQADMLANNGANQCFIWKVFANRGLGFSADQGSAFNRFDQIEAFDLPADISLPCETLSNDTFAENNLKIYPNPAKDIIFINGVDQIGNANLKVYDLNGRLLINKPLNLSQKQSLDISQFERGLYVLKIENTRINFSKKLIIN